MGVGSEGSAAWFCEKKLSRIRDVIVANVALTLRIVVVLGRGGSCLPTAAGSVLTIVRRGGELTVFTPVLSVYVGRQGTPTNRIGLPRTIFL
jgi:hypothetical protein